MKRTASAVVVALVCFAVAAYAQEVKFTRIGPAVGLIAGGDVESAFAYGLQGEVGFGEHLGVELSYMRFDNEREFDGTSLDWHQDTIGLSALARKNLVEDLSGYLLGGVNYNLFSGPEIDDEAGGHLGFGLNMQAGDFSEIFLEFRYTFLSLSGDVPSQESWDNDFGLIKLGMNFVF